MEQQRAINALAPFVALAKSATSPRAAADLVTQATSAPNTYIFSELLHHANIQALQQDQQYASFYGQLQMFAWGTWEEYKANATLPPLSDAQQLKLRLLSLLTIASSKQPPPSSPNAQTEHSLSYKSLCARLDLSSPIDLEHLVTQAIYSNLVTATLNPANQTVVITSVAPLRDLAPGSLSVMIGELEAWSGRCDSVLADLEAQIAKVKSDAAKRFAAEQKMDKQFKAAMGGEDNGASRQSSNLLEAGGAGPGGSGVAAGSKPAASVKGAGGKRADADEQDDDAMDVDTAGLGAGGGKKRGSGVIGNMVGKLSRR